MRLEEKLKIINLASEILSSSINESSLQSIGSYKDSIYSYSFDGTVKSLSIATSTSTITFFIKDDEITIKYFCIVGNDIKKGRMEIKINDIKTLDPIEFTLRHNRIDFLDDEFYILKEIIEKYLQDKE